MIKALLGIILLGAALPSYARTFCCDTNGRMYCDEGVPAACQGKAYREVNSRGIIVKQYEAPLTAEQIAKREAEAARKAEEKRRAEEEERKNLILLSTYGSTRDIDLARDRTLADLEKLKKQAEDKMAELDKIKKKLANDAEFYKHKELPPGLKAQMKENDSDMKAQKKNVDGRIQDMETAKAKYEAEKKRYIELTAPAATPAPAPAAAMDGKPKVITDAKR